MINIYIVRHGQTQTNLEGVVCGQYDTKMTKLGHKQIEESKKKIAKIEFDYLYTSALTRAKETASYFNHLDKFEIANELMEMDTGDYSHLKVDELWSLEPKLKYQGRYQYQTYPKGESLALLYRRISSWLNLHMIHKWQNNTNILIVGHEATQVCAIHHYLQIPLENYPSFKVANGSIVNISCNIEENQFRVEFL